MSLTSKFRIIITIIAGICIQLPMAGQGKYSALNGKIRFFSSAPLEDIEAESNKVKAALDTETGDLLFIVPINTFVFDKSLMQKHFNEQYLESDKYPEARFTGKMVPVPSMDFSSIQVLIRGELLIHGVKNDIETTAQLTKNEDLINGFSVFKVRLEDHDIKIPRMVIKNIAEVVEVTVSIDFLKAK